MGYHVKDGELCICLEGRISSENAAKIEKEIGDIIARYPECVLVFDAEMLEYISSAGLRVLLGFQKMRSDRIIIENVSNEIYEIFDITGFGTIFDVKKKLRNVSIDGCEQVGTGLSSKAYRIDSDTIIKVYDVNVPLYKITREIDLAKKAFLAGLPTAISYDLVRCGDAYGVVFEMIANAVPVGAALSADNGANFEPVMEKFAALMKLMHHTETKESDGFPSIKGTWLDWAEGMRAYYTDEEHESLVKMIMCVPDRRTIVHCDFHAGNTMYQNGEVVVIDMADVGYAHPVFDFAAGAFHDMVRDKTTIQNSLKLSAENIDRFWNSLLTHYFDTTDEARLAEIKGVFEAFACLRGALFPMKHVQISEESKMGYVGDARKNLFPRIDWAIEQARRLDSLGL